jgi:DNA-binding MarR family transcriptional regulator
MAAGSLARQLRRLEKQLAERQEELLAPLSADERERFTELLSKLLDHHDRRAGAADGWS